MLIHLDSYIHSKYLPKLCFPHSSCAYLEYAFYTEVGAGGYHMPLCVIYLSTNLCLKTIAQNFLHTNAFTDICKRSHIICKYRTSVYILRYETYHSIVYLRHSQYGWLE